MQHYDVLPYESNPFSETHPRNLFILGRLFRLSAVDPARCRVLELGCAAGGNLIPMAWRLPGSEFVGIDLEERQIRDGKSLVSELGLGNIRLEKGDILELGDELGQFDYIIAHGVYSWVPSPVREAMMALCKRLLRPQGIAYISYNIRPGWNVRGLLREILLYHVRGIKDPRESLVRASEMLSLLSSVHAGKEAPLSRHLLKELQVLMSADSSYLYHEYLVTHNEPVLVTDFLEQAKRHGLRYLCETRLYNMFASSQGTSAEKFLSQVDDQVVQEQYLDLLSLRAFRQTLLCHEDVQPDYEIDLDYLDQCAVYGNLEPPVKLDLRRDVTQEFQRPRGQPIKATDRVMKAMLAILHEGYPSAISVPELVAQARQRVSAAAANKAAPVDNAQWRTELFSLFAGNVVNLSHVPAPHDTRIPDRPRAHALARAQNSRDSRNITTIWHESLNTDDFSRRLLLHLDGSGDRPALVAQLIRDVDSGSLTLPDLPENSRLRLQAMALNVDRLLSLFARNGILDPAK